MIGLSSKGEHKGSANPWKPSSDPENLQTPTLWFTQSSVHLKSNINSQTYLHPQIASSLSPKLTGSLGLQNLSNSILYNSENVDGC